MNPRCNAATLIMTLWLAGTALAVDLKVATVSPEEARNWIRYTVPLPRQIEIPGMVRLPVSQIVVRVVDPGAAPLVQQAAKELREVLGGKDAPAGGAAGAFTITLQLGGDEANRLKTNRHDDQAYSIEPVGKRNGLLCAAIGPRGLYYAAKTLQQLIKPKLADGQVRIPMVKITDWPDMEDRGLWGGDASSHLRWLSDRKMNYLEHISHTAVDKDGRCSVSFAPFKQRMIDEGPTYGINPVPVILHLEQLKGSGLFEVYPDLQGKDATPGVICYSNPKIIDVLAEWLVLWGKTPGVTEVDVWMAENMYGKTSCQCERCKKEDRAVMEARVVLKAWDKARLRLPKLGLRLLTSEASEKSNEKILEFLSPGVKLWYYHSLWTYNTSHSPMVRPYLEPAIRKGRWVGMCPNIAAVIGTWGPMSSPAFIHGRMNEFVDKGISGIIGYATPQIPYCLLNTEAAAEWTWNAKGRSPHEFALSFAVRQGYKDPEKFAEWTDTLGPVSWDVYGSEFPSGDQRSNPGKMADLVKKGKLPELGYVLWDVYGIPFGDIKTVDQLNRDVQQAAKGVQLARELGIEEYLHESLVIQGYMNAIKALWELKQLVKPDAVSDKAAARKWFQTYEDSLKQASEHLPAWAESVAGEHRGGGVVARPVELLDSMIDGMKATAKELGASPESP